MVFVKRLLIMVMRSHVSLAQKEPELENRTLFVLLTTAQLMKVKSNSSTNKASVFHVDHSRHSVKMAPNVSILPAVITKLF